MRYTRFGTACVLFAATSSGAFLLQLEARQAEFRASVRRVALFVTVRDGSGRLITDLTQDAFEVLDDGRPATITTFSSDIQPISAVVMVDTSSSMDERAPRVRDGLLAFFGTLLPPDRLRLGTFGLEVAVSPLLTGDRQILRRIVSEEFWSGGSTPLWRAIAEAIDALKDVSGRKTILVLTDGFESSSANSLPTLPGGVGAVRHRLVEDERLILYAVGFLDAGTPSSARGRLSSEMVNLVEATGGGLRNVKIDASLAETFSQIADELRHEYAIAFSPATLDGKVHKIDVHVRRPGLSARARRSYLATDGR